MSSDVVEKVDPRYVSLWDYGYPGYDVIGTRSYGFWLYMMSDIMIFAALFAAHGVYTSAMTAAGGPTAVQVIHPFGALIVTLFILSSILAYGLGMVEMKSSNRIGVVFWLAVSFMLAVVFLSLEGYEFAHLVALGALPERSGFLSDFWTLVITHAVHVLFGLIWMGVMIVQLLTEGFSQNVVYRLNNLKIFWHFQAVIWICIFVFVYLVGVL